MFAEPQNFSFLLARHPHALAMRHSQIFAGSSHPQLVERICERLGQKRGDVELRKFANGETSVQIRQ